MKSVIFMQMINTQLNELNRNMVKLIGIEEKILDRLEIKSTDLIKLNSVPEEISKIPINKLLSLPSHLQTTIITLAKLKSPSAADIADITKRCRSVESNYLNQLERMGLIKKMSSDRGKVVYWSIK